MLNDEDRHDIALPASMIGWAKMLDRRWVRKKDAKEVQEFLKAHAKTIVEATEKMLLEKLQHHCWLRKRAIQDNNCAN